VNAATHAARPGPGDSAFRLMTTIRPRQPEQQIFPSTRSPGARGSWRWSLGIFTLGLVLGHPAAAQTILGSTGDYAVMAGSAVTNSGITTINGNLGGASFAGDTITLTGAQITGITAQNQTDFTRAFTGLAAMTPTTNLTGMTLGTTAGAVTLAPGIYHFDATAQLTGTLILDAQNQSNAVWVFQIGSTLTTAVSAHVVFTNLAANSVASDGLFWQVGSATTFGALTSFEGNLLGGTTFSFGTGATIHDGRILTGTGVITLDANTVDFIGANSGYSGGLGFTGAGNAISAIPEPATSGVIAALAAIGFAGWRRRRALHRVTPHWP
jgi:hypothetical protein